MLIAINRDRSLYFGLMEVIWLVAGGLGPTLGGCFHAVDVLEVVLLDQFVSASKLSEAL